MPHARADGQRNPHDRQPALEAAPRNQDKTTNADLVSAFVVSAASSPSSGSSRLSPTMPPPAFRAGPGVVGLPKVGDQPLTRSDSCLVLVVGAPKSRPAAARSAPISARSRSAGNRSRTCGATSLRRPGRPGRGRTRRPRDRRGRDSREPAVPIPRSAGRAGRAPSRPFAPSCESLRSLRRNSRIAASLAPASQCSTLVSSR